MVEGVSGQDIPAPIPLPRGEGNPFFPGVSVRIAAGSGPLAGKEWGGGR